MVDQTLFNGVMAQRAGKLTGADGKSKVVSAEQMEISRLRAELARVTMERDILGKATAHTTQRQPSEVRLRRALPTGVADFSAVPSAEGERGGIPCEHLARRVSRAGEARQRRHLSDEALLVQIKAIHAEMRGCYG